MRPILTSLLLLSAAAVVVPAFAAPIANYTGHKLASRAKVTLEQAEIIALKARPGKVTDKELEKEAGGSGLRFSFDIVNAGVTYEVGVDAKDGKVLENVREGAHPD